MIRVPHRCSHCGTRHTFKHRWDTYKVAKKCRGCGGKEFRVDQWMLARNTKGCSCDGYHFPHRKGSKWCRHYVGQYTNEELQERHCA